jgi:hypothetical protein
MIIEGKYEASNVFIRQGITLDLEKKCYSTFKKILSLIPLKSKCAPLPNGKYLLLFRVLYAKCESCTEEDYQNNSVYQLSLVYNKFRKLIIHETHNRDEIFEMSMKISNKMGLKIKDSATDRRNPKWVN